MSRVSNSTGEGRKPGMMKAFSALKHRGYRWYFISGLGMTAAQGIQQLALAWLMLDLTGSVAQLGTMIFIRGIPMAVLSLFGGVMADRYNRRNLLITNQAATLINMLALGLLTVGGVVEVWHIYVTSLLLGVTGSLTAPARQALIRGLVGKEEMLNAVALNSMQMNASRIIWPTISGALIAVLGTGSTLFTCAALSLVGVVFMLPIKDVRPEPAPGGNRSPVSEIVEGVRYTFSTPVLREVMTLLFFIGTFGLIFVQTGPAFAREVFGMSSGEAGLFLMAGGFGSLFGNSILLFLDIKNRTLLFSVLCTGFGLSLVLIAANPWYGAVYVMMVIFGLFNGTVPVMAQTIFQIIVPQRLLGRVFSLFMMPPAIASLATLPFGIAGEELGLRWALGGIGGVMVVAAVILGFLRLARLTLQEAEPSPDRELVRQPA